MRPEHNLQGLKFNKWTVLEESQYKEKGGRDRFWLCRCECGIEKPVKACYLKSGQSKQCANCAHESQKIKGRKIPNAYWENLKRNAQKRNIGFDLTKNQVFSKLQEQSFTCALSGLPIKFAELESGHLNGETTASVDRICSDTGYTEWNIQLVHKAINFMKNKTPTKEFISLCAFVANHNQESLV